MVGAQRLQLRDELGVTSQRQVGFDPLLERDQPELFQTRDLGGDEALVREVGKRGAAPERERGAELPGRCAARASPTRRSNRVRSSSSGPIRRT
jgi:hypothetical protein